MVYYLHHNADEVICTDQKDTRYKSCMLIPCALISQPSGCICLSIALRAIFTLEAAQVHLQPGSLGMRLPANHVRIPAESTEPAGFGVPC